MWKFLVKKHPVSIIEQFPFHFNEAINNTNSEKLIGLIPYYRTSIGKNHYIKGTKSGILKFLQTSRTKKAIRTCSKNIGKIVNIEKMSNFKNMQ